MSGSQRIGGHMLPLSGIDQHNPIKVSLGRHRCVDCGAEQNVTASSLDRLTHAPHCRLCGGVLLDARDMPTKKEQSLLRCGGCGAGFVHTLGLFMHLTVEDDCYFYLEGREEEMTELLPDAYCFMRTIHVVHESSDCRWNVFALRPNRSHGWFGDYRRVRCVRQFLRERLPKELLPFISGLSKRGRPPKEEPNV